MVLEVKVWLWAYAGSRCRSACQAALASQLGSGTVDRVKLWLKSDVSFSILQVVGLDPASLTQHKAGLTVGNFRATGSMFRSWVSSP